MDITQTTAVSPALYPAPADLSAAPAVAPAPAPEAAAPPEAAVYEPGDKTRAYTPDTNKMKQLWAEHDQKVDSFRRLIEGLLNKQAQKDGIAQIGKGRFEPYLTGGQPVEADEETRAAAAKEVAEGGYYSVEETASRILSFAVALSGGDPAKAPTLRDAALKGFAEAEKAWGKELPEISKKTIEAVKNGFDEWEKAGNADAISLLKK